MSHGSFSFENWKLLGCWRYFWSLAYSVALLAFSTSREPGTPAKPFGHPFIVVLLIFVYKQRKQWLSQFQTQECGIGPVISLLMQRYHHHPERSLTSLCKLIHVLGQLDVHGIREENILVNQVLVVVGIVVILAWASLAAVTLSMSAGVWWRWSWIFSLSYAWSDCIWPLAWNELIWGESSRLETNHLHLLFIIVFVFMKKIWTVRQFPDQISF